MCAYNVRAKKTLDHDPDDGGGRQVTSWLIWICGAGVLYALYLLARHYL